MHYLSTNNHELKASFKEAVIKGLPADKGLFMPQQIKKMNIQFMEDLPNLSYEEIGLEIARSYIDKEIPEDVLTRIVDETLNFEIPVVRITDSIASLELFHGPTMAFKDVGARFMARCLGYFSKDREKEITVLVATSGDTGSAVANGFYDVEGIRVVILYPSGKISDFQEKQMTTLGKNIVALEVDGNFDDCQHLVKSAFNEDSIQENLVLTSANSINIARLVPQIFYYFIGFSQISKNDLIVSVPSGNYGNLTAGLMAKRMGLPIKAFVASSNRNDIVPHYLHTGIFNSKPSVSTISNAMDVGNPSNFARMLYLYDGSFDRMKEDILGYSFNDAETRNIIFKVRDKYGYIMDPHGAVGYLGLKKAMEDTEGVSGLFLETAHPSKFKEVVEPVLEEKLNFPQGFQMGSGSKKSIPLKNNLEDLTELLLS